MKSGLLVVLTSICLLFAANVIAQQNGIMDFEKSTLNMQKQLVQKLVEIQNSIESDCGYLKKTMDVVSEGSAYLGCYAQQLENALRIWQAGNKEFFAKIHSDLESIFIEQINSGDYSVTKQKQLGNVAGYLHSRMKTWHQNMVATVESLYKASLLNERNSKEAINRLQASMKQQTKLAKDYLNKLSSESVIVKDDLQNLVSNYLKASFTPLNELVDSLFAKCNNDLNRSRNNYQIDFSKRPRRFQEVTSLYEEVYKLSVESLKQQVQECWIPNPVQ